MIKKLAMLCLGLGIVCSAMSAEWVWVYDHGGYRQEIDRESLVKTEKGVQVWDRVIPPGGMAADPEGFLYRYIITWRDYDCQRPRVSVRRQIYVGDSARQVKESSTLPQSPTDVKRGTPKAKLWAAACGKSLPSAVRSHPTAKSGSGAKQAPSIRQQGNAKSVKLPDVPETIPLTSMGAPQLLPNRQKAEISKQIPFNPVRKSPVHVASVPVAAAPVVPVSVASVRAPDCIACIACTSECRLSGEVSSGGEPSQSVPSCSNTLSQSHHPQSGQAVSNTHTQAPSRPAPSYLLQDSFFPGKNGEILTTSTAL